MPKNHQYDTLEVEDEGPIRVVSLNRADRHNALSPRVIDDLRDALARAAAEPGVGVLVLRGHGPSFCAGADLSDSPHGPSVADISDSTALFNQLEDFPQPTIVAVHGVACAGGLELVLASDLVVADADARIADIHANVGLLPGTGGAFRLVRRVGPSLASEMIFTGEFFPVADLKTAGLVNRIAEPGHAFDDAMTLARTLASKSPLALAGSKRLIRRALELDRENALAEALDANRAHMQSHDYAEGLAAMREKRRPQFAGS